MVAFASEGSSDPDGALAQFTWDFGDGASAEGPTAAHAYAAAGTYTATLTVVDDDGASDQASLEITVAGCPEYASAQSQGPIDAPAVLEASGLAVSAQSAGVIWTHNDSDPDGPRVYALGPKGALLGTYTLQGADVDDWEDMALGPGPKPGQAYLYIGDIGDNQLGRPAITVYRAPEPPVNPRQSPPLVASIAGVEALQFNYPGNLPHDAETMLVDPRTGDLYVVTKVARGQVQVFHAAAPLQTGPLAQVASIDLGLSGLATGGSVSAAGDWVVVRTYFNARMWARPAEGPLWHAFMGEPCEVPVAMEMQGEAVAFAAEGLDYFTLSEGAARPLYRFARLGRVTARGRAPRRCTAAARRSCRRPRTGARPAARRSRAAAARSRSRAAPASTRRRRGRRRSRRRR
jgi:PKD repeat protein